MSGRRRDIEGDHCIESGGGKTAECSTWNNLAGFQVSSGKYPGNACGGERGEGTSNQGAETHLGYFITAIRRQGSKAANQNPQTPRIGKTAERIGGNGYRAWADGLFMN